MDQDSARATSASDLETSIADRITRLTAALGAPFEHPELAHYAAALEAADRARSRSRQLPAKVDLLSRIDAFLAAHEIALSVLSKRSDRSDWDDLTDRAGMLFNVESIRRGHIRTMKALRSLETAFFTSWNEETPAKTQGFWTAVQQAGLPYVRRDLLGEIFNRGRIPSREHYAFAVDVIGVAEAEGLLDADQVERLGRWIAAYEKRQGIRRAAGSQATHQTLSRRGRLNRGPCRNA